jgi:hypothetical protein
MNTDRIPKRRCSTIEEMTQIDQLLGDKVAEVR